MITSADLFPEWEYACESQTEVFEPEGDTDDRDAEDETADEVDYGDLPPA